MVIKIPRCFDSHVHLHGTGEVKLLTDLSRMQTASDLEKIPLHSFYRRQGWALGFGWDQNRWTNGQYPTRRDLDKVFPNEPVAFIRADGHAVWCNSTALSLVTKKVDLKSWSSSGGVILKDGFNEPTGIFLDDAKKIIDSILPTISLQERASALDSALTLFWKNGFSHLRDMTCTFEDFEILSKRDLADELKQYIECYFAISDLSQARDKILHLRELRKRVTPHLKAKGIKIFYDGALGSEGALLSKCYCGTHANGLRIWNEVDLENLMKIVWQEGFELAIHAIGDLAVHEVLQVANKVNLTGIRGSLHIEHVELLGPQSTELLSRVKPVIHIQPSHYLTDQYWLKKKIPGLYRLAFPISRLEELGIDFFFGSDSPIASADLSLTYRALAALKSAGWPSIKTDWWRHHVYSEDNWGQEFYTEVEVNESEGPWRALAISVSEPKMVIQK